MEEKQAPTLSMNWKLPMFFQVSIWLLKMVSAVLSCFKAVVTKAALKALSKGSSPNLITSSMGIPNSQVATLSMSAMRCSNESKSRANCSMRLITISAVSLRSCFCLTRLMTPVVPKVRIMDNVVAAKATSRSFSQVGDFFSGAILDYDYLQLRKKDYLSSHFQMGIISISLPSSILWVRSSS